MPERTQEEYPTWIGFIFVFNLIVGTGALTLPSAFAKSGWLLASGLIIILAFVSYLTVTFVIETMACANAVVNWKRYQLIKRNSGTIQDDEYTDAETNEPLLSSSASGNAIGIEQTPLCFQQLGYYNLINKIEMGEMTELFFNKIGRILFYVCISIYLFGDLSIYSAAVAKSIKDVICSKNMSSNSTDIDDITSLCWSDHSLTRFDVYRLCLIGFVMILGPFVFFNVQKTKYLQMLTVVFRWLAFAVMISLAIHRIFSNDVPVNPVKANIEGVPYLIGTCIYSFMCHHSLPSLLTPIANKKRLKSLISYDYILISIFYLSLALTGVFAFAHIKDLYTLNFIPENDRNQTQFLKVIEYFLALFPVFTLSASFPIIAITLKNNLQSIFLDTNRLDSYNFFLRRFFFPIITIVPPICVTFFTESVMDLVGFTGGYAGTVIQYLIPVTLVFFARSTCKNLLGNGIQNEYASPFKSNCWLILVLLWTTMCVIFVSIHFFRL